MDMKKKVTFKCKIVAECDEKDLPVSIAYVIKLLETGKFKVESPEFFDEPTILLTEIDLP